MEPHVYVDGSILPAREARVSPFDRGLLVGDAVFETLRAYSGKPFDLDAHVERLQRSATLTGLALPDVDLQSIVADVIRANGLAESDAAVRITLTAGEGGHGVSRRGAGPPSLIVTARPVHYEERTYTEGIHVVVAETIRRAPPQVLDPRVKSANYLSHVLARQEAEARGADDAILLNVWDEVCEATTANVFAVMDGEVVTPPLESGCLDGLTRARVLDLLRESRYAVAERPLTVEQLVAADEIFLTASVAQVVPVATFIGQPVGRVTPGPVARSMLKAYRAVARAAVTA